MANLSPESRSSSRLIVPELEVATGFENSQQLNPVYPDWIEGPQGRLGLRFEDIHALSTAANNLGASGVLWFSIELPYKSVDLKLVEASPSVVSYMNERLVLDLDKKDLVIDSETRDITNQTYKLLELFMTNPGIVFSKTEIIENVVELDRVDVVKTSSVHKMVLLARRALGEFSPFIQTSRKDRSPYSSYFFNVKNQELSTA